MLPATPRLAEEYAEDLENRSPSARGVLLTAALSTSPLARDSLETSEYLLKGREAARTGLAELVARGLIIEEDLRLWFPRPLLRVAVLYLESGTRRMADHAVLGRSVTSPSQAA